MRKESALDGILVAELGNRIATGVAGTLLAQAGADVVVVESDESSTGQWKWKARPVATAGKRSIRWKLGNAEDNKLLDALIRAVDVVIISSDVDAHWRDALAASPENPRRILCDITAYGSTGPLRGQPDSDLLVQAASGIMDVTGMASEPPTAVGVPVTEVSAGLYGAAAMTAALRSRDLGGAGQTIEISLYDCGVNAQATFFPLHFAGRVPRRAGNRHSMCAPWNCYKARDRWILVCSATNDQWIRLCEVMGRADLATKPELKELADRLARCDEVDEAVQNWVGARSCTECIDALGRAGIACGPIVPVASVGEEPNLAHRKFIRTLDDPASGRVAKIAASPFHATPAIGRSAERIPAPDGDREAVAERLRSIRPADTSSVGGTVAPLAGVRVLEIGQYTTAPLAARHLATLGAEVIKIEPPQGESSRFWPPHKNGQGYFFTMSNSDKRSVVIDLDSEEGHQRFHDLLSHADIFVENTKPGSLERRGFGPRDLAAINPRLIYCAISGFGYTSAYPRRPAFDTVIQAMSGVMDLTRSGGVPVKAGISVADIIGGQFALLAILLALKHRDATGQGAFIDLAMQEACAWATQFAWNGDEAPAGHAILRCSDGLVAVDAPLGRLSALPAKTLPAAEVLARLAADGIGARRVLTISELAKDPQLSARELILWRQDDSGTDWPLLGSPMRLARTPPQVQTPIGLLGSGNAHLESAVLARAGE